MGSVPMLAWEEVAAGCRCPARSDLRRINIYQRNKPGSEQEEATHCPVSNRDPYLDPGKVSRSPLCNVSALPSDQCHHQVVQTCCKRAGKEVGMEEWAMAGTDTAMMAAA